MHKLRTRKFVKPLSRLIYENLFAQNNRGFCFRYQISKLVIVKTCRLHLVTIQMRWQRMCATTESKWSSRVSGIVLTFTEVDWIYLVDLSDLIDYNFRFLNLFITKQRCHRLLFYLMRIMFSWTIFLL